MALTRRTRRSNRSGRTSLRDAWCGSRIWGDLLEGGFCQGMVSDPSGEFTVSATEELTVLSIDTKGITRSNSANKAFDNETCECASVVSISLALRA